MAAERGAARENRVCSSGVAPASAVCIPFAFGGEAIGSGAAEGGETDSMVPVIYAIGTLKFDDALH